MRLESRQSNKVLLVSESKQESELLDKLLGSKVDDDGKITDVTGELRLSTDLSGHYLILSKVGE
jgi:hypothetical protein